MQIVANQAVLRLLVYACHVVLNTLQCITRLSQHIAMVDRLSKGYDAPLWVYYLMEWASAEVYATCEPANKACIYYSM